MVIKQVFTVLNSAMQQVFGDEVANLDLTGLISYGANALNTSTIDGLTDNLYNALLDRVYNLVISAKKYTPQMNNIVRESGEFGALLEKIYFEPINAEENKSWSLTNGQSVDPFKVSLNEVKVKVFSQRSTWEIPYTVTDNMLKTAFLNENEMTMFLSGLQTTAENSMAIQFERMTSFCVNNFISQKIKNNVANGVVDLAQMYYDVTGNNIAEDNGLVDLGKAYTNKDFLRFCSMIISSFSDKFKRMTSLYNDEEYKRFTEKENQRMYLISDFSNGIRSYLLSDTYNNELLSVGDFESISSWQGGNNLTFSDNAKINVKTSDESSNEEYTGVVGLLFDYDALGVSIWNRRTTSQYNGKGEYNNYWNKADVGLFNDFSENAVVFRINSVTTE